MFHPFAWPPAGYPKTSAIRRLNTAWISLMGAVHNGPPSGPVWANEDPALVTRTWVSCRHRSDRLGRPRHNWIPSSRDLRKKLQITHVSLTAITFKLKQICLELFHVLRAQFRLNFSNNAENELIFGIFVATITNAGRFFVHLQGGFERHLPPMGWVLEQIFFSSLRGKFSFFMFLLIKPTKYVVHKIFILTSKCWGLKNFFEVFFYEKAHKKTLH